MLGVQVTSVAIGLFRLFRERHIMNNANPREALDGVHTMSDGRGLNHRMLLP